MSALRSVLSGADRRRVRALVQRQRSVIHGLRESLRVKDQFLATLAHELRNPLSALSAAVQVLRTQSLDAPTASAVRDILHRQVEQMSRILGDVSDVARITRSGLTLQPSVITVASIVTAAVETTRPLFAAKNHELQVRLPAVDPGINVDGGRVAQVLCNLLANAAKYTESGGRICVEGKYTAEAVTLSVTDNGIGIAADSLSAIFEMFTQLKPAVERAQGGLGIGLALAKGIVELHGGRIVANSDGPGRGSRFEVSLPLRLPPPV